MEKKGKKTIVVVTCKPSGCKCNICGGFIPEGDSMCGDGHGEGKRYPVPVSEKRYKEMTNWQLLKEAAPDIEDHPVFKEMKERQMSGEHGFRPLEFMEGCL